MTVIVSDDFSGYANTAALLAVWVPYGSVQGYNNVSQTLDPTPGAKVSIAYAYPDNYGFVRTFTTADGLLPNTAYTVAVTVVTTDTVHKAGLFAGDGRIESADAAGTYTLSVVGTSDDDGNLDVALVLVASGVWYWSYVGTALFTDFSITDGATASDFTSALPVRGLDWDQIAYTAGVISVGDVVVGVTRGGLRFDPGETFEALPFDGDFIAPVGVHEMTSQKPRFIGSFLPVGPRHLALYLPKSTQSRSGDATLVTPIIPGTRLVAADYSRNVSVTWPYLSGGTITVNFPYAFWQRYEFNPENKGELLVPCEILAVPHTASTAPYTITTTEPGTFS